MTMYLSRCGLSGVDTGSTPQNRRCWGGAPKGKGKPCSAPLRCPFSRPREGERHKGCKCDREGYTRDASATKRDVQGMRVRQRRGCRRDASATETGVQKACECDRDGDAEGMRVRQRRGCKRDASARETGMQKACACDRDRGRNAEGVHAWRVYKVQHFPNCFKTTCCAHCALRTVCSCSEWRLVAARGV